MDTDACREAFEAAKNLVIVMNGLSEEGFKNKYMNDPAFNKGVTVIVGLYLRCPKMTPFKPKSYSEELSICQDILRRE